MCEQLEQQLVLVSNTTLCVGNNTKRMNFLNLSQFSHFMANKKFCPLGTASPLSNESYRERKAQKLSYAESCIKKE